MLPRRAVIDSSLDKSILEALGQIVVEFNLLELSLSVGIQVVTCSDPMLGEILVSELSVRAKIDIFFSALRHVISDEKKIEEFDKLRVRILHAEQERNTLLHSIWAPADSESGARSKTTAKAKRGLSRINEKLTAQELKQKAEEFHLLAEDIITFIAHPDTPWQRK